MKGVILAGGVGSRLRPLTLNTPKPIVPIFDRPFLYQQINLLKQVPEIDEVILSLNYQPEKIEAIVGHGEEIGIHVRYLVEPYPLGTGGAVKYAEPYLDGTTIVFNGDILTQINLSTVLETHRSRAAQATIVLTPTDNPLAYGLVESDSDGTVTRFIEKPNPTQITCNTINAGIYVLEPDTFNRIPPNVNYSIERFYFPSLIERGDAFSAHINSAYWLDIGTPGKYLQSHRDILDGRCHFEITPEHADSQPIVMATANIDENARIQPPCFIGSDAVIMSGATIANYSVIGRGAVIERDAAVHRSIIWPESHVGIGACLDGTIIGHRCNIGDYAQLGPGVVLGDNSTVTPYTRATDS